jgi:hypothetical protein
MTRTRHVLWLSAGGLLIAVPTAGQSWPQSSVLPDNEIRKILVERIDAQQQSVGMVVGVIEPTGRRIVMTA